MNAEVKIFSSIEDLNVFARDEIARIAAEAIQARGIFTIALSGGSTPRKLYEMLAAEEFQNRVNPHQTHFFFGDERFVPPDSEESNFRMANEALFSKTGAPPQNIHRFLTEQGEPKIVAEKTHKTASATKNFFIIFLRKRKMDNETRDFIIHYHLSVINFPTNSLCRIRRLPPVCR